jgi:hypothetical protein
MYRHQLIVSVTLLVIATFLFAGVYFRQDAQSKQTQTQGDEPTLVKRGQTTDVERVYSKEYNELYPSRQKNKLSETRTEIKDLGVMIGVVGDVVDLPGQTPISTTQFLNGLACKSDAIVVGSVRGKKAHLSEDESYVYTDYELNVADVLKNNSGSPVESGQGINVTRPGGKIKLDDRIITVTDERFEQLQLGKRYLLFLRFVPAANGYMAANPDGDFVLENDLFKKISKNPLPSELGNGKSDDLLSNIRESISSGCKNLKADRGAAQ